MFLIQHIQDRNNALDFLEIKHSNNTVYAKIDLLLGGSLQELKLNNSEVIKKDCNTSYNESYASAILFPFTNRVKNGSYMFNNIEYNLDINQIDENNAIHGLVFNKQFHFIKKEICDEGLEVSLSYTENNPIKGFPFKYSILLKYKFTQEKLQLRVIVKNTDTNSFPYSLGWHPYFFSSDLQNSCLSLKSKKRIYVDENKIPLHIEEKPFSKTIKLKNKAFDDCFILENKNISFKTPDYNMDFSFSAEENYIQLYTPKNGNTIAIEPLTSPSNSFNNKIGLKILQPSEEDNITWTIELN